MIIWWWVTALALRRHYCSTLDEYIAAQAATSIGVGQTRTETSMPTLLAQLFDGLPV